MDWQVILTLLLNHAFLLATSQELCWEKCFQVEDEVEERFREVYDDFYRMGMEARRLRNLYAVNGTAFLLDSTLSAANPEDPVNPVYKSPRNYGSSARDIWEFQTNLAAITMILMGTGEDRNPIYLVQFDETNANSCDEFHCLHACEADYLLDTELDVPQPNAFQDGNIEAACSMSKYYMSNIPCASDINNEMVIAFLNSGVQFERYRSLDDSDSSSSSSEEFHGFKPCFAHFDTRMAIGTHMARWENLDRWSTKAARPFYFHENVFTMSAARSLRRCLSTSCCPQGQGLYVEDITGDQCKITQGEEGEGIKSYPGHSSFGPD